MIDRAVVLAQPDRAVAAEDRVGEVALVTWMTASSRTRSASGASAPTRSAMLLAHAIAELAPARGEHLVEQIVAADRLDRGQQAGGKRVVVGGEEILGGGGHVVEVARPADAMADGLTGHEVGRLECPELLEDAGPARAEALGELVGRARAVEAEAKQQVAAQVRRALRRAASERPEGARRGRRVAASGSLIGEG